MPDILFAQDYYEPTQGIMYISAVLKRNGFSTDVAIGGRDRLLKEVAEQRPKVVGFYSTTGYHHSHLAVAKELKKLYGDGIITLFGGPHPTFDKEMIKDEGVDIVCRGEGEYAVLELMQAFRAGSDYTQIRNLTVKRHGEIYENELRPLCDLNMLPHCDREIYRKIKYFNNLRRQSIMLSRGCLFSCSFCSEKAQRQLYKGKGDYMRLRAIPDILEELEEVKSRYKPRSLVICDENFFKKKDHYIKLLTAVKQRIDLPYVCMMRADSITDETARALKETGCHYLAFGIESGNELTRNRLLKKAISNAAIFSAADLLHKYKLSFGTLNMVGLPGERLCDVQEGIELNAQVRPAYARFSVYQPLPATELAEHCLAEGYIKNIDAVSLSNATCLNSSSVLEDHKEGKKILRLKNLANLLIRFPSSKWIVEKVFLRLPFDRLYEALEKLSSFLLFQSNLVYKMRLSEKIYTIFFYIKHRGEFR